MTFTLAKLPASDFRVVLKYHPFLHGEHRTVTFECHVRGAKIAEWTDTAGAPAGTRQLTIPANGVLPDGTLTLDFVISEPRSPAELGASEDRRKLGIGIESIELNGW